MAIETYPTTPKLIIRATAAHLGVQVKTVTDKGVTDIHVLIFLTCRKIRPYFSLKTWRYYQIFVQLYNFCNADVIFPTLACARTVVIVTSAYTLLKLVNKVHLFIFILMTSFLIDGLLAIKFLYGFATEVYLNSKKIVSK